MKISRASSHEEPPAIFLPISLSTQKLQECQEACESNNIVTWWAKAK